MSLARKFRTAVAVYRRAGLKTVTSLAGARAGSLVRASALALRSDAARARALSAAYNDRAEFSSVPIEAAEAAAVRASLVFAFLRGSFADAAAFADRPALRPVEVALVADGLFRTWDFGRLADRLPEWRVACRSTKFARRLDQIACRAALRLGRLGEAASLLDAVGAGDAAGALLRGDVLDALGRLDAASAAYVEASHRAPEDPLVRLNTAFHLLKTGRVLDGLASWGVADALFGVYPLRPGRQRWTGEPLGTGTLLVLFEHGLGDMIQFARFLRPLRRDHPRAAILGSVPAPLAGLLARSFPDIAFVSSAERDPLYDVYVPSVQLASALDTSSLEPRGHYLDLGASAQGTVHPKPRVGVCWRGHPRQYEATRSIPLERFARLFDDAALDFVVLLNTLTAPERATLARYGNVTAPPIADFVDLGTAIAGCDLVVSVDTATVHVAAAASRAVLLLSRPDSCWRWGPSGRDSPWYASVEVLRHAGDMDWERMLDEVAERLGALAPARAEAAAAAAE